MGQDARTDLGRPLDLKPADGRPGENHLDLDSRVDRSGDGDSGASDSSLQSDGSEDSATGSDSIIVGDSSSSAEMGAPDAAPQGDGGSVVDGPVAPPFICLGLTPEAGNNAEAVELQLDGNSFEVAPEVKLVDLFSGQELSLGGAVTSDRDGDQLLDLALVSVPSGTPQGMYSVWIENLVAGNGGPGIGPLTSILRIQQ